LKITLKNKETGVNQPEESEGTKQARGNEPGVEKIGEKNSAKQSRKGFELATLLLRISTSYHQTMCSFVF